jgi:hypothetical protein
VEEHAIIELRRFVALRVAAGFEPDARVATLAVERFRGALDDGAARRAAVRAVARASARHAAEQRTWPVPTDCDRLDRAFARLERQGIVARQDFSCCQACGHGEIWREIIAVPFAAVGYAFYHRGDTDAAVDGLPLRIGFGAVEEGDPAGLAVGWRVVEALRAEGLEPAWTERLEDRIAVPLLWRRRRRRGSEGWRPRPARGT